MYGCMDVCMHAWMDGCIYVCIGYVCMFIRIGYVKNQEKWQSPSVSEVDFSSLSGINIITAKYAAMARLSAAIPAAIFVEDNPNA